MCKLTSSNDRCLWKLFVVVAAKKRPVWVSLKLPEARERRKSAVSACGVKNKKEKKSCASGACTKHNLSHGVPLFDTIMLCYVVCLVGFTHVHTVFKYLKGNFNICQTGHYYPIFLYVSDKWGQCIF